jgi:tetrahydromethanopterin S-methyltransferase subunit G
MIIIIEIVITIVIANAPRRNMNTDDLTILIDRMDTIERKLDLILQKLDGNVIKNCDKMGSHIDFVNGVYATVKVPLNYISTKIHKLANPFGSPKELPLPLPLLHDDNNEIMK